MAKNILVAALFILGVSQVSSIKCYFCASTTDCADPVNTAAIETFDCENEQVCYKMGIRFQIAGLDQSAIARGCIPADSPCTAADLGLRISITSCHLCDTDLCNASVRLTGGIYAVLPMIVSLLIAKIKF
ncbi:lymphocyte antigen 6E-like [Lutzomyia longipalpis]|uniref:lymphocyte antigen 6E-like n=1 Tax=Lutzomyia longipalpis TaxID=7200 RepID=UPI002483AC28|nr:lymphocyte antigen 6E-like [Lutzomyia longipalpis]